MGGIFSEISKALSFHLDVFVRLASEELLGMIDLGWHAQHRSAVLCGYATPSCFVAKACPDHYCVGFNMLDDPFRDLFLRRLRKFVTMSVRGGNAYECVQHGLLKAK